MKISTMLLLNPDSSAYDGLMHRIVGAARQIEAGALKLVGTWSLVPVKSTRAVRACRSTVIATRTTAPSSNS